MIFNYELVINIYRSGIIISGAVISNYSPNMLQKHFKIKNPGSGIKYIRPKVTPYELIINVHGLIIKVLGFVIKVLGLVNKYSETVNIYFRTVNNSLRIENK